MSFAYTFECDNCGERHEDGNNCLEVHADGVKEVKCELCDVPCGNEWCCMKEQQ